jgi:hypothetical protein
MKVTLIFGDGYDTVLVNDEPLPLEPSLKVFNHSPSGFSWGYGGSGPAQLALALLLHHGLAPRVAVQLHQTFKEDFVAQWSHDGPGDVQVHDVDIDLWLATPSVAEEME